MKYFALRLWIWVVDLLNIFVYMWILRIIWWIECSKTQFIWNSKHIIIKITIDFSCTRDDDILLIPLEVMLCRLHVYVNIPVTRNRCSTPEDMPVCCRAVVGPEPSLDTRSEPPPPPAGMSPSSYSGCFVSAAHLHMFYCTLPIYLSSNWQDKQFDLQTWVSCLNISARFNMEENILYPYSRDMWHVSSLRIGITDASREFINTISNSATCT